MLIQKTNQTESLVAPRSEVASQHQNISHSNHTSQVIQTAPNPIICDLCYHPGHKTTNCPNAKIFYHATNRNCLESIVQNGFIARVGRLGKAVYMSDDSMMCIRFAYRNKQKFHDPILLKIKVMLFDEKVITLEKSEDIKNFKLQDFKQNKIQAIQCPYFKIGQKQYNELALYKADYAVVSWSQIRFPQPVAAPVALPIQPSDKLTNSQDTSVKSNIQTESTEQSASVKKQEEGQQKIEEMILEDKNSVNKQEEGKQKAQQMVIETKNEQKLNQSECGQKVSKKEQSPSEKVISLDKRKIIQKEKRKDFKLMKNNLKQIIMNKQRGSNHFSVPYASQINDRILHQDF